MKKIFYLSVLFTLFTTACTSREDKPVLRFFAWNEYYDTSIIQQFEQENNVKVQVDYFANNEEALAKIEQQMATNKGDAGFDVFFPGDYVVEYLRNKNMLEKLDLNAMPHVKNNIMPQLNTPIDPQHEYAIPYSWGVIGILYNDKYIKEPVDSWDFILNPKPQYKGKILMIDSPKELVGIALKALGYPFNDKNLNHLKEAEEILKKQSSSVLNYNGDAIQESMPNEEAYIAVSWSAEARFAMEKNKNLKFVLPKEGSNLWMDTLVVLKGTKNKELAQKFIDFWYRDDIAKRNWDYMHMSTPSISFFNSLPEEEKKNNVFYPKGSILKKLDFNRDTDNTTRQQLSNIYTTIRS